MLIVLHVYLVRKRHRPAPGDEVLPPKILSAGVQGHSGGLYRIRDSVRVGGTGAHSAGENRRHYTTYVPQPGISFLFQTKLFKGPLEVFGSVVLPGLAI
jgi:hypothetical protein